MDKEGGPVIGFCCGCKREFLIVPGGGGTTEIHEVFKQNRKWVSLLLSITKEQVPTDVCPSPKCESPGFQNINNSKAQRIWEKIQAARQNRAT